MSFSYSDTDWDLDLAGRQSADYFRSKCVPFDSEVNLFGGDHAGANRGGRVVVLEDADFPDNAGVDDHHPVTGTTENVECSNRGICDHNSGTCKCFTGFTTED